MNLNILKVLATQIFFVFETISNIQEVIPTIPFAITQIPGIDTLNELQINENLNNF